LQAYGGKKGDAPFSQAIAQSPGFLPIVSDEQQENIFNAFLGYAGATSLEEARKLPFDALNTANIVQVGLSTYGSFTYGPAVDGDFVPELPGLLLLHGQFDKRVNVMVGHNADEGLLFTSGSIKTTADIENELRINLPDISNASLSYVVDTLYPAVYDGSYGYTDITGRAALIDSDVGFVCNTYYLDTAFENKTYAYKFNIAPGLHGQDVDYTFYNDGGVSAPNLADEDFGVASVDAALTLQDWIVTFTTYGRPSTPNVEGVPPFPMYGPGALSAILGVNGTTIARDDAANARCEWWQLALYF